MPPRPSPPPSGKPRRRPAPAMPGGWFLLLLMLGALLIILFVSYGNEGVQYGEFMRIINDDEQAKNIKKIAIGTDHVNVEVTDKDKLPAEIAKHISATKAPYRFTTRRLPIDDPTLAPRLLKVKQDNPSLELLADEDHMAGVWTLLGWLLPLALLAAFFFLFILPRFPDPIGG